MAMTGVEINGKVLSVDGTSGNIQVDGVDIASGTDLSTATAADLAIDASGFSGNLTTTDTDVQSVANKVDGLVLGSNTSTTSNVIMPQITESEWVLTTERDPKTGKPIYERAIQYTLGNNEWVSSPIPGYDSNNFYYIDSSKSYVYFTSTPSQWSARLNYDDSIWRTDIDGSTIRTKTTVDRTDMTAFAVIKMVKATDTAQSPVAQISVEKDIYSTDETLTNKVFNGKPIYRKIVNIAGDYECDNLWHLIPYPNLPSNANIFDINVLGSDEYDEGYNLSSSDAMRTSFTKSGFNFSIGTGHDSTPYNFDVVVEYTKD